MCLYPICAWWQWAGLWVSVLCSPKPPCGVETVGSLDAFLFPLLLCMDVGPLSAYACGSELVSGYPLLTLFIYFYVHVCLNVCASNVFRACGGQKKTSNPLQLELGIVIICLM